MKALITEGIVLSRTNFGEADRIITVLTPDQGKLRLMAKGVRKVKSKLAGGIELFSVTELSYISGRREIGTLVSSRLRSHYGHIVQDMDRVQLGYELIKLLNKVTEDNYEESYFKLLEQAFIALDDPGIDLGLIRAWFKAQLLEYAGHTPNLITDTDGQKLSLEQNYNFDIDAMVFTTNPKGRYASKQIKALRLLFGSHTPNVLSRVQDLDAALMTVSPLVNTMLDTHIT